jgi:ppGpp synthetase/RelA/SpoT-type nucleotidyltranferase
MKISIDPAWLDQQIQLYTQVLPHYKTYAKELEKILTASCQLYAPLAIVQVRAKSLSSFVEKAARKATKYNDPVHQFTDLCGARVITQTQVEVDRICKFIQKTFIIDVANSVDKRSTLGVSEFGYLSVHYIIQLPTSEGEKKNDQIMGIPLPGEIVSRGFKAEIQVRTMLQHAWAGISHDSLYKNMFKPPDQWEREMNRLAATLEETDQNFASFVNRLDTYAANHGAYLPPEERQTEIDILKMILDKEPEQKLKPHHALRIASFCRAAENWKEIVKVLTPFHTDNDSQLLRELGYALCRANRLHPEGDDYQKGIDMLNQACNLDSADPQMHECLAWALRERNRPQDKRKIHEHLARAYGLQPSNPYYLAAYLERELLSHNTLSHISLMRPTLLKAIETCRAHVAANIEIPMACFTTGRFYLYLKMPYAALLAYLDGLQLCLCEQGPAQYELLQAELDSLYELDGIKDMLPGYDAILRLLTVAIFIKVDCRDTSRQSVCVPVPGQKESGAVSDKIKLDKAALKLQDRARDSLETLKTQEISYQVPVVVVAGSCATAEDEHMQQYQELLIEGFQNYTGIIFSGGTLNGIGGLVGDLVENRSPDSPSPFHAFAYRPERLPDHAPLDNRYHRHIHTQGQDFSPLEPLQMWIDLLASEIDPRQVKILGIGGGDISSFEYRLAVLLGAQVGIIQGSGREADALLNDVKWNAAGCLLPLPEDRMSIKLFITNPNPMIAPDRIEQMAMKAHEDYRQERMKAPRDEPNLQPWEKLLPDFQNSNRQQAAFSVDILRQSGFSIEPVQAGEEFIDPEFTSKEIELMAEMEHGRWNMERLRAGWRYGTKKDEAAKISPCLIPWKSLDDGIIKYKKYDREAVCNFPKLLWDVGLKVLRIKKAC